MTKLYHCILLCILLLPGMASAQDGKWLHGIDVSHFQGTIDWSAVAGDQIHFAIVKATGGETYTDPQFHNNWHGTRTAGLVRGAYHFFYAEDDPVKQAEHFVQTVGELKSRDLPAFLDVEILDGVAPQKLAERVLIWLETVHKQTGKRPVIYSDMYFARQYLDHPDLAEYPLWIAEYSDELSPLPKVWQSRGWHFWQHSQSGRVAGIEGNVDLDVYQGGLDALKAFAAGQRSP